MLNNHYINTKGERKGGSLGERREMCAIWQFCGLLMRLVRQLLVAFDIAATTSHKSTLITGANSTEHQERRRQQQQTNKKLD